jgi:hypothetical protein
MRKRSIYTIPVAALAVITLGLTIGAATPSPGVEAPTPTISQTLPPQLTVALEEDDPGWNCETQGNRICGVMAEPMRRAAWQAFDAAGGAAQLLVNPHARVTLTGYSIVDPYEEGTLTVQQLALSESGVWYVFTAEAI